jgi:tetratricopeptide (TPR) repeat protein
VPIDRESTLRQAEKLQLQGRLDLAIAEYVRLVEEQPRDWNSINALGDLYLRAGDVDRAVAQFVRIADHLFGEGFLPKAAAVYKKALKAQSHHEHTLLRLAEIATVQELLADARAYLRRLWELRSERGDDQGAADCLVRLATLPEADAETILTGARAAKALGDKPQAISLFRAAADELQKAGRDAAALDAHTQMVSIDPADVDLRRQLAGRYVAAGQLETAGRFLDPETAGSDPDLLLALAQIELVRTDDAAARGTLTRFITVAPDRSTDILRIAGELGRAGEPARAFSCMEVVVEDALLRSDLDRAVDVLQSFLVHGPNIPALLTLVQVAGEAGQDDVVQETQERLADAYLESGQGPEARTIAESILTRAPDSSVHAARLRRALELVGVDDPDEALRSICERLHAESAPADAPPDAELMLVMEEIESSAIELELDVVEPDLVEPELVQSDLVESDLVESDLVREMESAADSQQAGDQPSGPVEIDLNEALASLGASPRRTVVPSTVGRAPAAASGDLDAIFDAMRPRAAEYRTVAEAAELYERGRQRIEDGQVADGLANLEEAARVPALRFPAAARLGREYVTRGHAHAGIEWFERAAAVPAPSREAGLAVLYELGVALDGIGERARALAVLMEIESDEPNYRDVRDRLNVLGRAESERRG